MLKKFNVLFVLLLIIPCMFFFTACKKPKDPDTPPSPPQTQTYNISYELNGGTNHSENPSTYVSGSGVDVVFKSPTKTGYEFAGWFAEEGFVTAVSGIKSTSSGDKTVYAKWSPVNYTITYVLDNGTNENTAVSFTIETDTITLLGATKTGYEFAGWYDGSDFTTANKVTEIAKGTTKNITLYAKFDVCSYTISYEVYGGENANTVTSYTVEDAEIMLLDASKLGYEFAGWYTSSNFLSAEKVTKIEAGSTGNKSLYAKFDIIPYKIVYHLEEGTLSRDYNVEESVTLYTPSKTGYSFDGWFKTDEYLDTDKVTSIAKGTTGTINLYGKFSAKSFKIFFDYNGADKNNTLEEIDVVYDKLIGTLPTPEKTGYDFMGWWSGTLKYDFTTIYRVNGDTTLTAEWLKYDTPVETFTVTFETGDGSTVKPLEDVPYGSKITEFADPTQKGYKFGGWMYNGEPWDFDNQYVTSNITLYASWQLIEYDITYNLDEGSNSPYNPLKYSIVSPEIVFADPNKDGYAFAGWYYDSAFKNSAEKIEAGSIGEVEIFARWKKIETGSVATVKISYNFPAYLAHVYLDEVEDRPVDSLVTLPVFSGTNLETYFKGYYYVDSIDGESLIDGNTFHIVSSGDLEIYAKWDFENMLKYYYTEKLEFELDEEGRYAIVKSYEDGTSSVVVIPKFWNYEGTDYPVELIAENCFIGNKDISEVFINAEGITVGASAFKNSALSKIEFTKIAVIENFAFAQTLLTEFVGYSNIYRIGNNAFEGCSLLTTVDYSRMNESYYYIQSSTFKDCTKLTNVILKSTINYIDSGAFENCTSLSNLAFLTAMENDSFLGTRVFAGCTGLAAATIPTNVSGIGYEIFAGCTNLKELKLYSLFYSYVSDSFVSKFGEFDVEKIELAGVLITAIPESYFAYLQSLKTFIMNDSIVEIGSSAFVDCTNLETIEFSSALSIEDFAVSAFAGTKWLNNSDDVLVFNNIVVYIPASEKFKDVVIGSNITAIAESVAINNTFIETITISSSVKSIGDNAFNGCTNLKSVTFEAGSTLESIGNRAFYACNSLANINLEACESLTEIGNYLFAYAGINVDDGFSLELPDSLQTIGQYVFYYSKVKQIVANSNYFETDEFGVLYEKTLVESEYVKTALVYFIPQTDVAIYAIPTTVEVIYSGAFVNVTKNNNAKLQYLILNSDVTMKIKAFYTTSIYVLKNNCTITFENLNYQPMHFNLTEIEEANFTAEADGDSYIITFVEGYEVNDGYYFMKVEDKVFMAYVMSNEIENGKLIDITDFVA